MTCAECGEEHRPLNFMIGVVSGMLWVAVSGAELAPDAKDEAEKAIDEIEKAHRCFIAQTIGGGE